MKTKRKDFPLLTPLRDYFEKKLREDIEKWGNKTTLRDACAYALLQKGKRIRPLIVLMVYQALGNPTTTIAPALSVEYFHTASLIADDLPCMDNDSMRRGNPSLHAMFGETLALLASYTLISAAYEKIFTSAEELKNQNLHSQEEVQKMCCISLGLASRSAGILGATGGQFLDLFYPPSNLEETYELIHKKTGALFEIAFVLGWIFGGGKIEKIEKVRKAALHLGVTFQLSDDMHDFSQEEKNSGNAVHLLGKEKATTLFRDEVHLLESQLKELDLLTPLFIELLTFLQSYFFEKPLRSL